MDFELITESIDVMIATSDRTSNATYFNKSWETFTGRTRQTLLDFGWADLIHEDDRQNFVDMYIDAFRNQRNWVGEFRMLDAGGSYRWLLAKGVIIRENDAFTGYVSSTVDITDQVNERIQVQRSGETLRQLVLTAPIGICVLSASLVAETVNDSFLEIAGKSYDTIMGQYYWDSFAEAAPYYADALKGVVDKGEAYFADEVPLTLIRHGKPEQIYVTFVYTPLKNVEGVVTKVIVWVLENTTQVVARQRIEEIVAERTNALAKVNGDLQASNAELLQFAYIASHDLQEPLRKITTYAQLLETLVNGNSDKRAKNYLGKISTSAARMHNLIIDVLNYSALSKDRQPYQLVNLEKIVDAAKSDYDLLIEQKEATITTHNLPVIEAIEVQMTQLIGNLISNSLKFISKDVKLLLHISGTETTRDDILSHGLLPDIQYYTIQFADNGIGIAPEHTEKIFNIFQRLHSKSAFEGTGIGLAMCKKIVMNHHGAINAEGSNDNGAVFRVILPVKQSNGKLNSDS